MATTKGRKRCACRRVLLERDLAPATERIVGADLVHTVMVCEEVPDRKIVPLRERPASREA
jgi:hypothetical protein